MTAALFGIAAYLIGAVPTGYLAGRAAGVDLRRHGSGNIGATNVYRIVGGGPALVVVSLDAVKGFVPVWFFPLWDGAGSPYLPVAYGLLAIIGHVRSAFLGFRGGKGVATGAGTLAALVPLATLVGTLVWLGLVLSTRLASLASLTAALTVPAVAWLAAAPAHLVAYASVLSAVIFWTHRRNLLRLLRREELRLGAPGRGGGGGEAS